MGNHDAFPNHSMEFLGTGASRGPIKGCWQCSSTTSKPSAGADVRRVKCTFCVGSLFDQPAFNRHRFGHTWQKYWDSHAMASRGGMGPCDWGTTSCRDDH